MRGKRDPQLERAWRRRVRQQRGSGLSVRGFCEQRGLAESAFHFWRRELVRRDDETRAPRRDSESHNVVEKPSSHTAPANSESPFVSVVIAEPDSLVNRPLNSVPPGWIELVHPGGVTIRVPSRCDADVLRVVFDLLDERLRKTPSC